MNAVQYTLGMKIDELKKQATLFAYRAYGNNKTATANSLGISVRTLDKWLEEFKAEDTKATESENERAKRNTDFLARCRGQHPSQKAQLQGNTPHSVQATAGPGNQPPAKVPAQQAVSVSKRKEV